MVGMEGYPRVLAAKCFPTSFRILRPLNSSKTLKRDILSDVYTEHRSVFIRHTPVQRERERERGRKPASAKYCINKCTRRNIHGRAKPSPLPLSFPPFSRHYPPFRRSTISFFTPWTIKPRRLSRISTPRRSSSSSSRISEIPDSPPPLRKARIYS